MEEDQDIVVKLRPVVDEIDDDDYFVDEDSLLKVYYDSFRVIFSVSIIFFAYFLRLLAIYYLKQHGLIELFLVMGGTILCVTIFDQYIVFIIIVLSLLTIRIFRKILHNPKVKIKDNEIFENNHNHQRLNCLTMCRSSIYIITSVCITAVDFKDFPEHLMKTREYGAGLMDTGIGLFIFSIAVVSKPKTQHLSLKNINKLTLSILPLIVLGIGRTLILMAIDYQQDVTEYGLHWNSFLTLALTKYMGSLICMAWNGINEFAMALMIITFHELSLQSGLAEWALSIELGRDTFLTANREGIVSTPGLVALYLASIYIRHLLDDPKKQKKRLRNFCFTIFIIFILVIPITWISRRIANMGYFLWILLIASVMLYLFLYLEEFAMALLQYGQNNMKEKEKVKLMPTITTTTPELLPTIADAVNYNPLVFFLISNFLTGLIKIFLNPERRNQFQTIFILMIYMSINCYLVVYLHKKKIKIS